MSGAGRWRPRGDRGGGDLAAAVTGSTAGLGSPSWRRRTGRQDLGDQLGPELVALAGDVAQAENLDAAHRRDHGAAEELEPYRVTRSPAMAATSSATSSAPCSRW